MMSDFFESFLTPSPLNPILPSINWFFGFILDTPSPPRIIYLRSPMIFLRFCSCNTSNPDHINLTFINSDVCSTVEILGPLGKKSQIRALQYPHSSQKCICLAVNDHVMLYDVTKKKIRQDFQKVPNVTCLTLSQTDKYIAAGNSNGYLYLLNPLTGRSAFTHPIRISGD